MEKAKPAEEPKRRRRPLDAQEIFVAEDGPDQGMNAVFRKRLTYLMNGNSTLKKPVNIQELADAVGVSRPAIRKYLKPKDHGAPTTPSASIVCRIASFFGTTPNFLLGFDVPEADTNRKAHESELYNRLGLNQKTIDKLHRLRELRAHEHEGDRAAALMSMLDRQISDFVDDAIALIGAKFPREK